MHCNCPVSLAILSVFIVKYYQIFRIIMEQFFLWLNIITFTILVSSLSSSFHIYIKNRCAWIKFYLLTQSGFILWLALYTYDYFSFIYISHENPVPESRIVAFLVLLFSGFTIYVYSLFLINITGEKRNLITRVVSVAVPLLFLGTGLLFIFQNKPVLENYLHVSFYLVLLLYSFYGVLHWKTLTHDPVRSWGFTFIILTLVAAPLVFFEYYLFHFSLTGLNYFPDGAFTLPLYCLTWGLWMIIKNSSLLDTDNVERTESIPADFITKHNITEREREILTLLITGNSNVDIASRLFISLRTVDTHIYNIYKKCGARNRIGLLKEIDSHRFPV